MKVGLRRGSALSTLLFMIIMDVLAEEASTKGLCKEKKFQKSEITMEVGGWVQVSLWIFLWKIVPK